MNEDMEDGFKQLPEEEWLSFLEEEFQDEVDELITHLERQNALFYLPDDLREIYFEDKRVEIEKAKNGYLDTRRTFDIAASNLNLPVDYYTEMLLLAHDMLNHLTSTE
ncbi:MULTISPECIES: hypothetical protein [Alkalihalophilus]|uniref:Uncharacterized protein n=1 Tax=Alkalihalophilus pseudofirmus (strain ATCC BAA-2126 / JCM 17055 / OF4) TaxID=398511 RepID=D3G0Z3_ALKPO|nr:MULTISPECIES: hypothetical protein [Alkalihalophilus]ADC52019.1 hypothetical protein BpOF4_20099 [Alkalihalophilus pseudofirmus OF4]MEC2074323.1 hypothetical protein [Alkalihalophilus marmarensis]